MNVLLKIARCIGVSATGMALANVAWAQDATVTTGAKSARVGAEFRTELNYNDHGLEKMDGADDPDATTTIEVQTVNLKLHGNINDNTEYGFRFNLLNVAQGAVDYGYGTHWLNKMMGFSVGKMKVMQGGWDTWDGNYRAHATGAYYENLVYDEFSNMIALHVNVAGRVNVQILNDKVKGEDEYAQWNDNAHPTWVVGWMGEFGPIKPLIDVGSYDNNKSMWYDIGIKTEMNGLYATLDYYANSFTRKGMDDDGEAKEVKDNGTAISLNVAYEVKNLMTPWFYFSTYDVKQGEEDQKYNQTFVTSEDSAGNDVVEYDPKFNDNGMTYGLGVNFDNMGKGWTPYVAYVANSGKFKKSPTEDKEESKSEMQLKLGVLGEI